MLEYMSHHQMYIVLGIVLLIWAGIVVYLVRLDGKITRLEKQLKKD
ncbi:MAG: CcmD family protein [Bacteroidetes bacterium]|nr:CcmD family protein [Bacteroidota bacterium]